jgi:hypothetical protein
MSAKPPIWIAGTIRVLIACAAIALVALRKSDSLKHPQFWAEDGGVFFLGAELDAHHGWGDVFVPYEGYFHLLPRLLAIAGHAVALVHVPAFYAWSALAVTGLTAWVIQSPRVRLPGAAWAALALGAVPHTGEVYLNLCNLQWITALALFAVVIADDAVTRLQRWGDIGVLVVTGLTGPFIVLALPLLAVRAWLRPRGWSRVLLGVALGCAAVQAVALMNRPVKSDAALPVDWSGGSALIGRRLVVDDLIGRTSLPAGAVVLIAAIGGVLLAAALWRKRTQLPGAGTLAGAAVLVLASVVYKARLDQIPLFDFVDGDRYFFIERVVLFWLLAALAVMTTGLGRVVPAALIALALAVNATRFIYPPSPDLHWGRSAQRIAEGDEVHVPILPVGFSFTYPSQHPWGP